MKYFSLFLLFTFSSLKVLGQHETAKWYFGKYAGLDFMTNPPTVLTNSAMKTSGSNLACTSMSDENGNLLFYSKGDTVFNKLHQVMTNGTGLIGQTTIFPVRKPGSYTIFYLFTIGKIPPNNAYYLSYSVLDMSLASGNGSLVTKNTPLYPDSCWGISATPHCNGSDIWIITHKRNSPEFRNYLLTSTGLSPTYVTSALGTPHQYFQCIKVNPGGNKILATVYDPYLPTISNALVGKFNLYDFNKSNGVVSSEENIVDSLNCGFCEVSPDGSKLYGVIWDNNMNVNNWLVQYDLCAGSGSAIAASAYTVHTGPAYDKFLLQKAPNGKIYMSRLFHSYLGVVNTPNQQGTFCNYVDNGQTVAPGTILADLPQFMSNYFKFPAFGATSSQTMSCLTASFTSSPVPTICSNMNYSVTGFSWLFGDPTSGTANTSTLVNPVHLFSAPGSYTVKQIFYNSTCAPDTIRRSISVNGPVPILSVTQSLSICFGQTLNLTASGADTYTWNTAIPGANGTLVTVSPTITTIYTVVGTNTVSNCSERKTVQVTVSKCSGIDIAEVDEDLVKIYPNPGPGIFHTESKINADGEVYNVLGNKVQNVILKAGSGLLDFSMLDNGLYFLKITENNTVFRIIKVD